MGRSNRFARDTLFANKNKEIQIEAEVEDGQNDDLPRIAIGRFVLDKLVNPSYGVNQTIYDYRDERRGVNVKGVVDFSCGHDDIFVPIVPETKLIEIIMNNHPAHLKSGLRKRQQEVSRAKKRIKMELSNAESRDIQIASDKSVALSELHSDPSFEHYGMQMFDPTANHEVFGEITVGLKSQPTLIDELTLGFNIQKDRAYVDSSKQVLHAISEAGYGDGLRYSGLNPMANASVPIIDLNSPLSSIRSDGMPNMPRPPQYIQLGPIVMVETF